MSKSQRIGYIRVSTVDQNTDRQLSGLELDRVFTEHASGKNVGERPALQQMITFIRDGDDVYVHSMDRLARNLRDLLSLVEQINQKGVTLHFVKENLSFHPNSEENPMATLMLSLLGAVAQFERSLILERQREGIAKAKAKGVYKGRKPLDPKLIEKARALHLSGMSIVSVASQLGVGKSALYKYLKHSG
jgi:DNA invertase Pin-like site-specific DNA recombinase